MLFTSNAKDEKKNKNNNVAWITQTTLPLASTFHLIGFQSKEMKKNMKQIVKIRCISTSTSNYIYTYFILL